jgi:hypothetical protein
MTSGIYLLKFGELTYVGKSVDIHRRLEQHVDSLLKGKAAKPVQNAYNIYGLPSAYILAKCHLDHIDTLEAYFIGFYEGPNSLNTVKATYIPTHSDIEDIIEHSTKSLDLIVSEVIYYEDQVRKHKEVVETLNQEIEWLEKARSDEELREDISCRIASLEYKVHELNKENTLLAQKLITYKNLPWYKRIFTKPL